MFSMMVRACFLSTALEESVDERIIRNASTMINPENPKVRAYLAGMRMGMFSWVNLVVAPVNISAPYYIDNGRDK